MKLRRILLTLLVLCLTVGTMVMTASAAEIVDSGTCGENLTWTLDSEGTLTISGTGEMDDYEFDYPAPWTPGYDVQQVIVENGVTSIGEDAFQYCSSLTSVTFGDGVTSIGRGAFHDCSSLTNITIPGSVTSIGNSAFSDCESLTSVTLGEGVTSIGDYAFSDCSSLTNITIPDSVTSIGDSAFEECSSLTSITLGDGVTSIGDYAFYKCHNLTSITLGDGVTSIGDYAFYRCYNFISITLGDSVTSIGDYAFWSCESLTSVTLGEGVTSIGDYAFSDCESLTNITIPDSVASIGNSAFEDCYSLTNITLGEGVTSIGDSAFSGCKSLTSITIPDSVTSIGDYAFWSCESLTSVTLGEGVTSIGDGAFAYCTSLSDIYVDSANQHYTSVDGVLFGKDKMELLICSVGKAGAYSVPADVTSIGDYAFESCSSLTSITIPDSVTNIGDYAFMRCSSLTSVTLGEGVTSIGDSAFYDCESLTIITLGDGVTRIGGGAFLYCSSLTSITIPDSVTSIGGHAFYDCTSLTSITFPKSVKELGASLFGEYDELEDRIVCESNLEKITFNGDAPKINTSAFEGVAAAAYYPADNSTWTESVRADYGGNITWKEYKSLSITTQPKTAYAKLEEKAKLTVEVEGDGLTYQWYVKDVGDSKYFLSSIDTPTYSVKMTEAKHGRKAYCVITDAYGNSVKTKTVYLRVSASVKTQPKNTYTQKDATAKVKVAAVGDELTYEWYIKNAGAKKYSKSSVTSATYSCKMTEKAKDRYVYCVVTDKYGNTEKSKTVVLRMAATITMEPKTAYAKLGEKVKITVKAEGDELTCQWYVKDVGDSKYFLSSIDTPTYSVKMTEAKHGRKAYCVITDKYGKSVQSKTVVLRMAATITTQPKDVTAAEGKTAKVTVKAVGDELTYTWYIKNEGATKFSKSSVTKATYSCKMSEKADGRQVYCVVTDKYGKTVTSNTVTLKMK